MNIRLKQFEIDSIINNFKHFFLPEDHLWLFGSRTDLDQRGGDIDLYIETTQDAADAVDARLMLINSICDDIGDQRIDVVLNLLRSKEQLPIFEKAKNEGIKLV